MERTKIQLLYDACSSVFSQDELPSFYQIHCLKNLLGMVSLYFNWSMSLVMCIIVCFNICRHIWSGWCRHRWVQIDWTVSGIEFGTVGHWSNLYSYPWVWQILCKIYINVIYINNDWLVVIKWIVLFLDTDWCVLFSSWCDISTPWSSRNDSA